jgi:hypothetical protein
MAMHVFKILHRLKPPQTGRSSVSRLSALNGVINLKAHQKWKQDPICTVIQKDVFTILKLGPSLIPSGFLKVIGIPDEHINSLPIVRFFDDTGHTRDGHALKTNDSCLEDVPPAVSLGVSSGDLHALLVQIFNSHGELVQSGSNDPDYAPSFPKFGGIESKCPRNVQTPREVQDQETPYRAEESVLAVTSPHCKESLFENLPGHSGLISFESYGQDQALDVQDHKEDVPPVDPLVSEIWRSLPEDIVQLIVPFVPVEEKGDDSLISSQVLFEVVDATQNVVASKVIELFCRKVPTFEQVLRGGQKMLVFLIEVGANDSSAGVSNVGEFMQDLAAKTPLNGSDVSLAFEDLIVCLKGQVPGEIFTPSRALEHVAFKYLGEWRV